MSFTSIAVMEVLCFLAFFTLERWFPSNHYSHHSQRKWWPWVSVNLFGFVWLNFVVALWFLIEVPYSIKLNDSLAAALFLYLFYSFGNYWIHRAKHAVPMLWSIHYLHHEPKYMHARVAFWRHPVEMVFNSLYLLVLGRIVFDVSPLLITLVLAIEGMLELMHHSNTTTPRRLRWLGKFIQLPEMHLLHHQRGLHKFNYSPLSLWDGLFGTARVPDGWRWSGQLGFNAEKSPIRLLFGDLIYGFLTKPRTANSRWSQLAEKNRSLHS